MKDKDIIQLLKDNLYAFGLWPKAYGQETGEAMQAKAREICKVTEHGTDFSKFNGEDWTIRSNMNTFYRDDTYRLREDYTEPEAGVEKCELERKVETLEAEKVDLFKELQAMVKSYNELGAGEYRWDENVDKYVWQE